MLTSGCYRVNVPEEGALLVVSWLRVHGHHERADSLVETLLPFFDALRFYPAPHSVPVVASSRIRRVDAGVVKSELARARVHHQLERMRESLTVWAPLQDEMISLLLETVEGEAPHFARAPVGTDLGDATAAQVVAGGEPYSRSPSGWSQRAAGLLSRYVELRKTHRRCGKPDKPRETFRRTREFLKVRLSEQGAATAGERKRARHLLARFVTAWGVPGSEVHRQKRREQAQNANLPAHRKLRSLVLSRLASVADDEGVADPSLYVAPVTSEEATRYDVPNGSLIAGSHYL